ncbi:MAG: aminoacyl-tRNA hydrolase [Patescibacteria group bacterium]|mgnify:CR=1 FL=1
MIPIFGLGNPGAQFKNTRHNIGRGTAEAFAAAHDFGAFRFEKKWNAQVVEGKVGKGKIVVILPDTMMNKSGTTAAAAARFFKTKPKDIFVIHDDADIALGRAKLSFGKRSAGHKGVESVIRGLKTREFWRFRIGIAGKRDIPADKLVLKKFTPDEQRLVKKVIKKTVAAIAIAAAKGPDRAMNAYNR